MITFTFNGTDFSGDIRVNEISGRGVTPSEVTTIEVPGMTGVHAGRKKRGARVITIAFTVVGSSLTDLRNRINTLSQQLDLDEVAPLVFSDEPDKTYFAILAGATDDEELVTFGKGTLTFLCPDPYKYGPELTATLNADTGAILNVEGTAPTKPIFELTAIGPETFAMVANDRDEYNMIGAPADVETTKYVKYTSSYEHRMQNMTDWVVANPGEVDHVISGTMASVLDNSDGEYRFRATDYGTGAGVWHGPAVKRSLPTALTNFRATIHMKLLNTAGTGVLGNVEMYLLDVNGQVIARVGLKDSTSGAKDVLAQARLGASTGTEGVDRVTLANTNGDKQGLFNDFDGIVQVVRDGQAWSVYFAKVDPATGRHHTRMIKRFTDTHNRFQEQVAQVVLATQQYDTRTTAHTAFLSLKIEQINKPASGVPYIVVEGDKIVFDHTGNGSYRLNGDDAKTLKNFGAAPFQLYPGSNTVAVIPEGKFNATVRWRNAYK